MRRALFISVAIVVALLAVFSVALVVAAAYAGQWARAPIERIASERLGREVRIEGPIDVRLGMPIRVALGGLRVANAEWSQSGRPLAAIQRIEAAIAVAPLVRGRIVVDSLNVHTPQVSLEREAVANDPRVNWPLPGPGEASGASRVELRAVRVEAGRVRYVDPLRRAQLEARITTDTTLDAPSLDIDANGRAFGIALEATAQVARDPKGWLVRDAIVRTQRSDVAIEARLLPPSDGRTVAKLDARLTSERIDFADFEPAGEARRAAEQRVIPNISLGQAYWPEIDLDIRLDAQRFILRPGLALQRLDARAVLEGNRLRLDPIAADIAGGRIDASLVLDADQEPMHARLNARFAKLALGRLLPALTKDASGKTALHGSFAIEGRGETIAEIAGHAGGKAQMVMVGGALSRLALEVIGLDAQQAFKSLIGGSQPADLRCGGVDIAVRNGVATLQTFVIDTTDTNLIGEGSIDLGSERLDLTLHPRPKDVSFLSLRAPIHIEGTLSEPVTRPDLGKIGLRAGASVLLGMVNPLLALAPLIETGPGEDTECKALLSRTAPRSKPAAR